MKRLVIEQTNSTLGVDFDPKRNLLTLKGESYPEDALKFFTPVLDWLSLYFHGVRSGDRVDVDVDIVYFNSSSSKALMNMFDLVDRAARMGVEVHVVWRHHVENEVARECGEEFGEDLYAAGFTLLPYGDDQ